MTNRELFDFPSVVTYRNLFPSRALTYEGALPPSRPLTINQDYVPGVDLVQDGPRKLRGCPLLNGTCAMRDHATIRVMSSHADL